jgi:hypothetical protein
MANSLTAPCPILATRMTEEDIRLIGLFAASAHAHNRRTGSRGLRTGLDLMGYDTLRPARWI